MSSDMSFFHLITGASIVVQLVMLLLLTVSLISCCLLYTSDAADDLLQV